MAAAAPPDDVPAVAFAIAVLLFCCIANQRYPDDKDWACSKEPDAPSKQEVV